MVPGEYVEIAGIKIDDGHALDYITYIAGEYRRQLDFAVSKGYLNSYEVLVNQYPRHGEPSVYLIQRFDSLPSAAESERRDREYREFMQRSFAQLQAESGERAEYRTVLFDQLLRKWNFRD